jgi:AraC-like DNA-binding protein
VSGQHGVAVSVSSVQAWVLPHLITCVEHRHIDTAPIRRLFGRAKLEDPNTRVPETVAETAWRLAATLTGDDALGIHVAETLPRGALDLIEYALRSSATLAAGFDRLARYGRLVSDRVATRTHGEAGRLLFLVHDAAATPLHPARTEFALAIALKLARESTGADITPVRVGFAHPAPDTITEHQRFFRGSVEFAAGSSSMSLSGSDAARPMRAADAALEGIIRRRLEHALAERDRARVGVTTAGVRHILVERLGRADVTLDAVSVRLAVSRRTLTRRLADEHTSFRQLLDGVRREFALALLQDRTLTVADIAFFLHYSEPAAFHRAFRRWTGETPLSCRS